MHEFLMACLRVQHVSAFIYSMLVCDLSYALFC